MSVTLELAPEVEKQLREKAAQAGQTLEEFLARLAESAVGGGADAAQETAPRRLSTEEWLAEWYAWVASHKPITTFVDDSRESIYEGRGE